MDGNINFDEFWAWKEYLASCAASEFGHGAARFIFYCDKLEPFFTSKASADFIINVMVPENLKNIQAPQEDIPALQLIPRPQKCTFWQRLFSRRAL